MVAIENTRLEELAPTFAFVDPFGWSGAPMDVMADLLRPRCELLFTFIYDQTSRFINKRFWESR